MYLVDTNIISARAPTKVPRADIETWMDAASPHLYMSVITAAEIEAGISKLFRDGASTKAGSLVQWWAAVKHWYGDRIIPLDIAIAEMTGKVLDKAKGRGHSPGFADAAVAATAWVHGYTVLTANVKHFQPFGVKIINPFEGLPPLP
ncbi:PIN domain-containing protein [Microvirga roseola]|uniref:PIN domain-containing protein n=1 Tax=Microvirga roseola TaxID=2883126 RepID=UPI001E56337D|nr:PIN domain-containing protein [Microvirga roseola]